MKNCELLIELNVSDKYRLQVYRKSNCDIIIKYQELDFDNVHANIHLLNHMHIAVDLLIKKREDMVLTDNVLDFLIQHYADIKGLSNFDDVNNVFYMDNLLGGCQEIIQQSALLNDKGEYSVKFLVLLIKLLMIQEKTNYPESKSLQGLLGQLRNNPTIWDVVSKANYR